MEKKPFGVDADMVLLIDDMTDGELINFATLEEDPTSDNQIELHIYICLTIFARTNSMEHLKLALERAEGWLVVTPGDHVDRARRLEILDMISFKMWQTRQTLESSEFSSVERQVILPLKWFKFKIRPD